MALQHQISITADSGVGSTTTAKQLHALLGISPWRWVNAGAIMRTFAEEKHMAIEEFTLHSLEHPEEKYDEKCDSMIRMFGEHDYVIFEGRLVHHFAPHAFHVRLVCDPLVRATRRAKDFPGKTEEEILEMIRVRDAQNVIRYRQVYGADVLWSDQQFDLVVDTGVYPPDVVAKTIVEKHAEWVKGK